MSNMMNPKVWVSWTIWIVILIGLFHTASASGSDVIELREIASSFDDPRMTVQDLAYYLVTHNYDAAPRDGYVELKLGGESYRLVPNGNTQGLYDISP